jgi:general secretion pathway protein A
MSVPLNNETPRSLTYETFFGLREKPFSLSSDPRFLYRSHSHAVAYDELLAGIRRREGLLVLTGDIGTGKTTLCRAALQNLDRKTFSAFVPDPFASREDLLKMLLVDFGVMSIQELATGPLRGASRTELSYMLQAFLETLVPLEAFVVVIIDEAQNMSLPLIEEVRILSDTNGRQSPLQVVFVGQLELRERLKLPEMRQVDQRVCMYARLDPLSPEAVAGYVQHRLHIAGGSPDRVRFRDDSIDLLYGASRGVPRLINRICDRALHLACLRRVSTVDPLILAAAADDVGQPVAQSATTAAVAASPQPAVRAPLPAVAEELPHSASVKEWLKRVEVETNPAPVLEQFDSEVASHVTPSIQEMVPDFPSEAGGREELGREELRRDDLGDDEWLPEKNLHRMRRRWFKKARTTAAWVIALAVVIVGTAYVRGQVAEMIEPPPLPAAPTKPALPAPAGLQALPTEDVSEPQTSAARHYVVEVALFATSERADRLVEVLNQQQFAVFQRPLTLGSGRVLRQVLLGPYATREDAEAELQRLQQTSGYGDARVAETEPGSSAASG